MREQIRWVKLVSAIDTRILIVQVSDNILSIEIKGINAPTNEHNSPNINPSCPKCETLLHIRDDEGKEYSTIDPNPFLYKPSFSVTCENNFQKCDKAVDITIQRNIPKGIRSDFYNNISTESAKELERLFLGE